MAIGNTFFLFDLYILAKHGHVLLAIGGVLILFVILIPIPPIFRTFPDGEPFRDPSVE